MNEREIPSQSTPEPSPENPENPRMREMFEIQKDRLIFEELKKYAEVPEGIKVFSHRKGESHYAIVIADGSVRTSIDIGAHLGFLPIGNFPEMEVGEDSYYRPLVYMDAEELTPNFIFINRLQINFEIRGYRITPFFYKRLEAIAKEAGYRFLAGIQYSEKLAKLYLQMGRYFFEEIKPEFQKEFEKALEHDPEISATIKFLDETDVERYVRERYFHIPIDERVEYNEKEKTLNMLLGELEFFLKAVAGGNMKSVRTVVGIIRELNEALPEDDRFDKANVRGKRAVQYLRTRRDTLLEYLSIDDMDEKRRRLPKFYAD